MSELVTVKTPSFFTYTQNNSGGSFTLDEVSGITHYVIIEAYSADEANARAENIGLYFDGLGDCECCGNRWSSYWGSGDGDPAPTIYGEPAESYVGFVQWMPPGKETVVHYLDGRKEWFGVFERK